MIDTYSGIQNGLATTSNPQNLFQHPTDIQQPQVPINQPKPVNLFSVHDFVQDLENYSEKRNHDAKMFGNNINSYDIAANCIRDILFKIQNYPIESYKDNWLPVLMRSTIGSAIHEFIQGQYTGFTEAEVCLKVPSRRLSIRLDNLINDNVLVEVKSCAYSDYAKIIRQRKPRDNDFYQTILYRWVLHNFLEEAKSQKATRGGSLPKLDKYNIDYIQIIYVAHDLVSADATSMSNSVKKAAEIRRLLNSKHNKFHFITTITLDMNIIDVAPYEAYIIEKIDTINDFLNRGEMAPMNNKFVKCPDGCFFCLYKDLCKTLR